MKFVSAVTALVAAMAVGSEAAKPKVSRRELKNRMKNGQFDKRTLMSGAKPHNEAAKNRRKLGNNMEITGDYSIQFKSCFSMTTSYEDMWDDDQGSMTMNLFSSGQLKALESYAIFALYYMGNAEEYIIDLNTYVQSLVNYLPDQMEEYCEACEENWETCQTMLYGQYGNQYGNQQQQQNNYANGNNYQYGGNYGNRKLSSIERVLAGENGEVRQLDCGLCVEYNCVNDDDNQAEGMGYEDAAEWLTELAECKETGISYSGGYNANGYYQQEGDEDAQLFAGMICNGDGSGIEIGMFYDEDCKLYLPNEAFSNYMSYYDQTYQAMTKEVIEFTFSDAVLSCKDQEVTYTTRDISNYNQYNYNGQNYNNDGNDDVADWCEGVVMGDNYPVDVNTCGNGYNNYNNNNNYYAQQQSNSNYDWYQYEISEDNAYSMGIVCATVKANGMHTLYNTANGNLYEYSSGVSEEVEEFLEDTGNFYSLGGGLSGGAKFAIISLVGIVIGAAVALYVKFQASTADDKNVGLIDPEEVETKGGEVA
jgi:hypothetical protein